MGGLALAVLPPRLEGMTARYVRESWYRPGPTLVHGRTAWCRGTGRARSGRPARTPGPLWPSVLHAEFRGQVPAVAVAFDGLGGELLGELCGGERITAGAGAQLGREHLLEGGGPADGRLGLRSWAASGGQDGNVGQETGPGQFCAGAEGGDAVGDRDL